MALDKQNLKSIFDTCENNEPNYYQQASLPPIRHCVCGGIIIWNPFVSRQTTRRQVTNRIPIKEIGFFKAKEIAGKQMSVSGESLIRPIEGLRELDPAVARREFDILARQEADLAMWGERTLEDKADSWVRKMAETYHQAFSEEADNATNFEAHWVLSNRYHAITFEAFHEAVGISWEGLTDQWQLIASEGGVGLFGWATTSEVDGTLQYDCVWYKTAPYDSEKAIDQQQLGATFQTVRA